MCGIEDIAESAIAEMLQPDGSITTDPSAKSRALRLIGDLVDERLVRSAHRVVRRLHPDVANALTI